MSLANILSLQGNSEKSTEALEWLRSAAKLKPDDSDILNNYASLLSSLGTICSVSLFVYKSCIQEL